MSSKEKAETKKADDMTRIQICATSVVLMSIGYLLAFQMLCGDQYFRARKELIEKEIKEGIGQF